MGHEQAKIEQVDVRKAQEISLEESRETFTQEALIKAEEAVVNFKSEGAQGIFSLEQRAIVDDLEIDAEDKDELVALNQEASMAKNNLARELQDFSKRYSPLKRSKVASEIWRLRKEHQENKKQIEQQNIEIQEKRTKINKEIENTKTRIERIERVISGLENDVREQKSKVWNKITSLFRKEKLADEEMLEIANDKWKKAKEEIQERFALLDETQNVVLASSGLEETREELKSFYSEQAEIKSQFEEEREQRDVKKISQDKGIIFLHGLPLEGLRAMNNTSMNNPGVKTTEISEEEKLKVLLGLEPTISSSAVRKDEALDRINTMYPFGVILKGGQILAAHNKDSSTLAQHIYNRKTKDVVVNDKMFENSSIQSNISENIDVAMSERKHNYNYKEADKVDYNEIIVENPQVAGFYLNVDFTDESLLGQKMLENAKVKVQQFCRQFNLPAFGMHKGKMHEIVNQDGEMTVDFSSLAELSLEDVVNSGRAISVQEKIAYANSVIENSPFVIETKHKENFDGFGYGRIFYDYVKRLQGGEKVQIWNGDGVKNSVDGSPEVFLSAGNNLRVTEFIDNGVSDIWDEDGGIISAYGLIRNFGFRSLDGARATGKKNQLDNIGVLLGGVHELIIAKREILSRLNASKFDATKVGDISVWKKQISSLLFFVYGLAEEAKKDGNDEVYAQAMSIVKEFGSVSDCEIFVRERINQNGKFQILEKDIPLQVRKRVAELEDI
ncbi:MAG: hypothetical protein WCK16_04260 [Candidatus Moraniibacteriota bacterium]